MPMNILKIRLNLGSWSLVETNFPIVSHIQVPGNVATLNMTSPNNAEGQNSSPANVNAELAAIKFTHDLGLIN